MTLNRSGAVVESEPMSKACLKCGASNGDDVRFCRQCGTPFDAADTPGAAASLVACRQCGHPNRRGVAFCARCGADQRPIAVSAASGPATRQRLWVLWAGLIALTAGLLAVALWWFAAARTAPGPTFDSAPPPSLTEATPAASAAPPAPAPASAPSSAPGPASAYASAAIVAPPPAPGATPQPAEPAASVMPAVPAAASAPASARARRGRTVARDAEATVSPRRRDEDTRGGAEIAPAVAPPPRAAAAATGRTVAERCGNENVLLRSLCEARECFRREHAGEPACLRIKAADERRRQREDRGG